MYVSDVQIKLTEGRGDGRVRAYATITFDDTFRIHDIKVIRMDGGRLIVAMPSRKISDHCEACTGKNPVTAKYCNDCGSRLRRHRVALDDYGRPILYADVAHPVHAEGREMVERAVLEAYAAAVAEQNGRRERIVA